MKLNFRVVYPVFLVLFVLLISHRNKHYEYYHE